MTLLVTPLASLLSVDFGHQCRVLLHACTFLLQNLIHLDEPWSLYFALIESWAKLLTHGLKLSLYLLFVLGHGESFFILLLEISWSKVLMVLRLDNFWNCMLGRLRPYWSGRLVLDLLNLRLKVNAFDHGVSLLAGRALGQLFLVEDDSPAWARGDTTLRNVYFILALDVWGFSDGLNNWGLILWFEPFCHQTECSRFGLKLFELVWR